MCSTRRKYQKNLEKLPQLHFSRLCNVDVECVSQSEPVDLYVRSCFYRGVQPCVYFRLMLGERSAGKGLRRSDVIAEQGSYSVNQVSSKLINHCRAFPFLVLSIFFSCFLPHQLPSSCTALYTLSLPPPSLALVAFNKNRTASFQIDYDSVQSPLQKAARIIISRDSTRTFVMLKRPPNKPKINRYRNRKPKIMLKFTE